MPTIRQLPPNLINQIAAGEVIERPASVVKELLENSIDAGARRVEVLLEKGGSELIRVSDDGCGIAEDQLVLAVTSHATSKLPEEESLFHVGTLGFRGEAMASIASVSHMTMRSRTQDADSGFELQVRGGVIDGPEPCGCPVGTVTEVRNLFFNTPVRRKFLRTAQTETGHISEAFTRIALANPHVHMVLNNGTRIVHDLAATDNIRDRIHAFFGSEISDSLIPVESDNSEVQLSGFVGNPSVNRANNRMQYLFLNGRHIRDRALQHAMGEAYRGLLMVGRFPVCFLRLDMPADLVDVNVHPTKMEVRFTESGRIYSQLLQTLRHKFLTSNLTASVGPSNTDTSDSISGNTTLSMQEATDSAHRQNVIEWARTGESRSELPAPSMSLPGPVPEFQPFPGGQTTTVEPSAAAASFNDSSENTPAPVSSYRSDAAHTTQPMSHLGYQIHNRYLVTQDETGMIVVDQHALHERILYEQIRNKVLNEKLETQKLLVPEPVSLTPAEAAAALDAAETLSRVGIEIQPFGGDTVLVSAYPAMLASKKPDEILRQALESLLDAGKDPDARDLLDSLLHMIACKAAIKAGDRLTPEEVTSLLEQRDHYQDTHHCPHGRPTALFFSRDELDRMFGRMGARKITS